jgi:hypothetical protein
VIEKYVVYTLGLLFFQGALFWIIAELDVVWCDNLDWWSGQPVKTSNTSYTMTMPAAAAAAVATTIVGGGAGKPGSWVRERGFLCGDVHVFDRVALLLCFMVLLGMHVWLYVYTLCWEEEMREEMRERWQKRWQKRQTEKQGGREIHRDRRYVPHCVCVCVCVCVVYLCV